MGRPERRRWSVSQYQRTVARGIPPRLSPTLDWYPLLRAELRSRRAWRAARRGLVSLLCLGYLWWMFLGAPW